MLAYALNSIRRRIADERRVEQPGTVFACADADEFASLEALGAVREPTETEVKLYHLAHPETPAPSPTEATAPKVETAAERRKREKDEAKAAAAEEADRKAAEEAAAAAAAAATPPETLE